MSADPAFRLDGLTRRLGDHFTLSIDHLEVAPGAIFGLLGPTGAGKSTLLRLLAGLDAPTAGTLTSLGHPAGRGLPIAVRRRLALVHQRPLLLSGRVRYNVAVGLRLRGRRPDVGPWLDRLGLADIAERPARTLSGGQVQLVALARALAVGPEVLLLDEPTAHLDPARVALVERAVVEANRGRGMTVVWATHNLFQARRVADRVGLLLDGRLVEAAPIRAFFDAPADPRTAAFVRGEMIY